MTTLGLMTDGRRTWRHGIECAGHLCHYYERLELMDWWICFLGSGLGIINS